MDKQELVSELDHYLMTKMIHAAAEGLEVQCYQEYWSKTEEGYRATVKDQKKEQTYQRKTSRLRDTLRSLVSLHHWLLQN